MTLRQWIHDSLLSIAFWQIALTPYLLLFLDMRWDQYGKWCLTNMPLSALIGPAFVGLLRWLDIRTHNE